MKVTRKNNEGELQASVLFDFLYLGNATRSWDTIEKEMLYAELICHVVNKPTVVHIRKEWCTSSLVPFAPQCTLRQRLAHNLHRSSLCSNWTRSWIWLNLVMLPIYDTTVELPNSAWILDSLLQQIQVGAINNSRSNVVTTSLRGVYYSLVIC